MGSMDCGPGVATGVQAIRPMRIAAEWKIAKGENGCGIFRII
jgi:hypothetical protein